jgi:molecular chaperone GrpE
MTTKKTKDNKKDHLEKKTDSSKKEIDELKNELKEKEDRLLRSIADFQNYQKRIQKDTEIIKEDTKKKYLCEIIELNELLKKAYEDNNPKPGLKLMINNLDNFFDKEQIKCIDCVGKKFDHNIHHAITTIEKENCEENVIVEEVKKGYLMNNKLLRPSQVIVSKKKLIFKR